MTDPDELDERLYAELLDYEKAAENASARFDVESSEESRRILYRSDRRLRYWCYVYIVAIDLFGPDPVDFQRVSCQSEILRLCEECGQPQLIDLFPKARESAWRGVVSIAERAITGEGNPEVLPIERKQAKVDTGLIRLGFDVENELEKAWVGFRRAVNSGDWGAAERLAKRRPIPPQQEHFLQAAIFSLWVHPDFPLWLMQIKPTLQLVNMLRELWGIRAPITRNALEVAKIRLAQSGQLVTNLPRRPAVITGAKVRVDELRQVVESYEYTKKFSLRMPNIPPRQLFA